MRRRWTKQDRANREHAQAAAEASLNFSTFPRVRIEAPWDDEIDSRPSVGPTTPPVTIYGPDGSVREVVSAKSMRQRAEQARRQHQIRLTRDQKGRWKAISKDDFLPDKRLQKVTHDKRV